MHPLHELCVKISTAGLISQRPPDSGLRVLELLNSAKVEATPQAGTHGLAFKEWNTMIAHIVTCL
jgi:hypothetical protein